MRQGRLDTLLHEATILWKNRLPHIYLIVTLLFSLIIWFLPRETQRYAAPIMIFIDPTTLGLFFVPAQILLLKDQGVLVTFLFVPGELRSILRTKVTAYSVLSVVSALGIGLLTGWELETLLALPGIIVVGVSLTLVGAGMGLRVSSLNKVMLLLPVVLVPLIVSLLPIIPSLQSGWWRLYPPWGMSRTIVGPWLGMPIADTFIGTAWSLSALVGASLFYRSSWKRLLRLMSTGDIV